MTLLKNKLHHIFGLKKSQTFEITNKSPNSQIIQAGLFLMNLLFLGELRGQLKLVRACMHVCVSEELILCQPSVLLF